MERPHAGNVGPNVQVEAGNESSLSAPRRITLSPTPERLISEWAGALLTGDMELWELPRSLSEFYTYAYEAGRESVTCDCEQLRFDRDRWYFVANNRGKKPGDYYQHLTNRLWAEGAE